MASVETLEIPVRRARQVLCLTGTALFGGWFGYVLVASGDEPLTGYLRFAFHICAAGLAVYGLGVVRLYYGIFTGRSRLTIGPEGVTLGDHRMGWDDIQEITLRPTSPVARYLVPPSVRIQARQRLRQIEVTRDHVKDLRGFADWLRSIHEARIRSLPPG
ncbi:hypothetical protein [Kribbella sp. NPDC051718]|uniref:hypothetical protein n=1 Tax=Kribbella sp. NPDC051718 TaxID=3155168 RepID=UPI00343553FD